MHNRNTETSPDEFLITTFENKMREIKIIKNPDFDDSNKLRQVDEQPESVNDSMDESGKKNRREVGNFLKFKGNHRKAMSTVFNCEDTEK